MFRQTLIAVATIALLGGATAPALAQGTTPPPAQAGTPRMYGYELMTPEERQAYIDKMRAAKTPEERTKLRDEHRAEMQKRAKEKGVTLSEPGGRGGPGGPRGPGGPGGGRMYGEQLFTQQERDDYRKRMQEAKTQEERDKIRGEARAQAEARAKEKGITLPPPRGPGGRGGPGGGRMYGEQLFSQQERDDYRKRMQEAKTQEERDKIRGEARAQAEARAKEKGITLPPPRGRWAGRPGWAWWSRRPDVRRAAVHPAGARRLPQAHAGSEDARGTRQDPR